MLLSFVCAGFHLLLLREGVRGLCILGTLGLGVLCIFVFPFMSTGLGLRRCAYRWTRPLGVVWRGYSLRDLRGVHKNLGCWE